MKGLPLSISLVQELPWSRENKSASFDDRLAIDSARSAHMYPIVVGQRSILGVRRPEEFAGFECKVPEEGNPLIGGGRRDRAEISRRYPRGDIEREKRRPVDLSSRELKLRITRLICHDLSATNPTKIYERACERANVQRVCTRTRRVFRGRWGTRPTRSSSARGRSDRPSVFHLLARNETAVDVRLRGVSC